MAATPGGSVVDLNGATHVVVLAAPASGYRIVTGMRVFNRDSSAVTYTVVTYDGANEREYDKLAGLAAGATRDIIDRSKRLVLDTTHSIKAFLGGAVSATNPVIHVTYLDIT